uniref:Uncharacterized protein n=1 Tax=Utricularia reniformis TaxID=192314 RepID=A0A1Y0AZK1_9LAMI|nr:hypothetical protein AEK19_MT0294 [Utricularia reniformis]ART30570.1 hypothetical protein AEK19_MT0294 [Utricularia reniformis]
MRRVVAVGMKQNIGMDYLVWFTQGMRLENLLWTYRIA